MAVMSISAVSSSLKYIPITAAILITKMDTLINSYRLCFGNKSYIKFNFLTYPYHSCYTNHNNDNSYRLCFGIKSYINFNFLTYPYPSCYTNHNNENSYRVYLLCKLCLGIPSYIYFANETIIFYIN